MRRTGRPSLTYGIAAHYARVSAHRTTIAAVADLSEADVCEQALALAATPLWSASELSLLTAAQAAVVSATGLVTLRAAWAEWGVPRSLQRNALFSAPATALAHWEDEPFFAACPWLSARAVAGADPLEPVLGPGGATLYAAASHAAPPSKTGAAITVAAMVERLAGAGLPYGEHTCRLAAHELTLVPDITVAVTAARAVAAELAPTVLALSAAGVREPLGCLAWIAAG
jgi:hypothetical protein